MFRNSNEDKNAPSSVDLIDFEESFKRRREKRKRKKKIRQIKRWAGFIVVFLFIFIGIRKLLQSENLKPSVKPDTFSQQEEKKEMNPYQKFSAYQRRNLLRYQTYKTKNPQLSLKEVLWQVNVNLDQPFYTDYDEIDGDTALLINKYHALPKTYVPSDLTEVSPGILARKETSKAFIKMQEKALEDGFFIQCLSGYRNYEKQEEIYQRLTKDAKEEEFDYKIVKPGFSEHQSGRALDVSGSEGGLEQLIHTPEYEWILNNAHLYGFIQRYPQGLEKITGYLFEPWHITFVGTAISIEMKEKKIMTLEEYMGSKE